MRHTTTNREPSSPFISRLFFLSSKEISTYFQFFVQKKNSFQTFSYLCNCYPPMMAGMSSEEDGAAGWSTTY